MQPVYFFSRHNPDALMIEHLGNITAQFHGTITNIRRVGDTLSFDESINGETVTHQIPSDSIVVAVAPITLQVAWLTAGVSKLLIPQTTRETSGDGSVIFRYAGLRHIKSIVVDSEQFAGVDPTLEGKSQDRSAFVQSAANL